MKEEIKNNDIFIEDLKKKTNSKKDQQILTKQKEYFNKLEIFEEKEIELKKSIKIKNKYLKMEEETIKELDYYFNDYKNKLDDYKLKEC